MMSCFGSSLLRKRHLRNRLPKRTGLLLTLLLFNACFSGCYVVRNELSTASGPWSDQLVAIRNRSFSAKAWLRRKHNFADQKFNKDFRAGFRAGYEDVASGKDGCCPATPPQRYWGWEFQSREGQGRTQAWFAGYPYGAQAAEEEGVANWNQMPMSLALQQQYQQNGTPLQEESIYPIPDANAAGIAPEGVPAEAIPLEGSGVPVPKEMIPVAPGNEPVYP